VTGFERRLEAVMRFINHKLEKQRGNTMTVTATQFHRYIREHRLLPATPIESSRLLRVVSEYYALKAGVPLAVFRRNTVHVRTTVKNWRKITSLIARDLLASAGGRKRR